MNNPANLSKSFCVMPWVAIATDPRGGLYPCCWMDRYSKYQGPAEGYKDSDYLKQIKQDFLEGRYPATCKKCEWNDKSGLVSKRTRENDAWFKKHRIEELDDQKYDILDLRLSNKCNLSCVTCFPGDSSAIFEETKKHYPNTLDHYMRSMSIVEGLNLTTPYNGEDIDYFISNIKPHSRVYFTGGEPGLVKPVADILDRLIDMGYNTTVSLDFNSNFQALNQKWFDKLKLFKGTMLASVDAVGARAELIRYGCKWESVDRNVRSFIDQCTNFNLVVSPTPSILNIFYLNEIVDWTKDLKNENRVSLTFQNRLSIPGYLDLKNLPEELKSKATQRVNEITMGHYRQDLAKHLAQQTEVGGWENFIFNMDKLDKIRGTSWREVLPDLNFNNN